MIITTLRSNVVYNYLLHNPDFITKNKRAIYVLLLHLIGWNSHTDQETARKNIKKVHLFVIYSQYRP